MRRCTWQGSAGARCADQGSQPVLSLDGSPWAHLCPQHEAQLVVASAAGPKQTLAAWVSAQGGPGAAAERMKASAEALGRLAGHLMGR